MTLTIKVAGEDITDDVIIEDAYFTQGNGPNPGDFSLRVKDPQKVYAFRAGHPIEADFGGVPIFDGYVVQATERHAFPVVDTTDPEAVIKIWQLQGVDVNILFRKRYIFNQSDPGSRLVIEYPAGTSDLVYIRDIMAHLTIEDDNLITDFHHVASPEPDRKGLGLSLGDSWETAFAIAARIPGAVWGIRPGRRGRFYSGAFDDAAFAGNEEPYQHRVVYWEDDDTITAPFAISDTPTSPTSYGYSHFEWLEDGSKMVNDARIWGVGLGSPNLTFVHVQDEDSIAEHGRWENEGGWRYDLYKLSSVTAVAESLVYGSPSHLHGPKDPAIRVKCRVKQPGLMAGDKVRIISDVYGEDIVLPIRRLKATFLDKETALFDLEASWEVDAALTLFDYPPTDEGDEPPPEDTEKPSPCIDGGSLWTEGSGWYLRRSDPRLGVVAAFSDNPGRTSFSTIRRYWNEFVPILGFGWSEGVDNSELYAHFSKTLPWSSSLPWGIRFNFQTPLALNPSDDESRPQVMESPVSLAKYPQGALDIQIEGSGSTVGWQGGGATITTARLMYFRDGNVYVGGETGDQVNGGTYTFERTPNGQMYVFPASEARPAGNGNVTAYNGGSLYGGPGLPVRGKYFYQETANQPVVIIAFQLIGEVAEGSVGNLAADSDGHATLTDRFLHEGTGASFPGGHNRAAAPFATSVYRYGESGPPSQIKDSYIVSWEVSNVVFYQSATTIEAADCIPIVGQPARGERYGQTPTRINDITFQTSYGFVPGSSSVTVDGIQFRNGIDYTENAAAGLIFFMESVPAGSTVYIYYETLA